MRIFTRSVTVYHVSTYNGRGSLSEFEVVISQIGKPTPEQAVSRARLEWPPRAWPGPNVDSAHLIGEPHEVDLPDQVGRVWQATVYVRVKTDSTD